MTPPYRSVPVAHSDDVKLTVSPWTRVLFALGTVLGVVGACLSRGSSGMSVVLALVFGVVTVATSYEIRAGEWGVERRFPLFRPVRVHWEDLTSVEEIAANQALVLRARYGKPLEVAQRLENINDFRRLVLKHAPPAALPDDVRALIARRIQLSEPAGPSVITAIGDGPPTHRDDALGRWRDNPFFVLGLDAECSRADVERTGQKLLALLAIESKTAKTYTSPVGSAARTPESVRTAMAELRDPERRVVHEVWARLVTPVAAAAPAESTEGTEAADTKDAGSTDPARPWPGALAAIGWRAP